MFEQVKHNLETIDGVETFPIISLLIFFSFFVGLGIWVFSYKKERIDELSQMPLEDNKIV
ncbi:MULTISPECIES: cbb3-type cytochrome c oxidase subunit 3 [Flavobacterium]|uniref:Cbb3-type cytochrome oxidase component FixQ n=1 Tax=Flavobacterium weaverense TaxID=271156 RepID=A0A3M0A113_9FLAO|nr:cbb3-type cytochrome c oxidase subunit 3 [Flavobacterium weaverense]RMA78267.1 Cbb3-type cytochrome oxidase component FixQ [Flavobacterium weaverense]